MMKSHKIFFVFFLSYTALYSASWYNKIYPSIEVGMHFATFNGDISNANSTADIQNDLGYVDNKSTYLSFNISNDIKYIPNFSISYFNDSQTQNHIATKTTYIADGVFETNSTMSSDIDYSVINAKFYYNFNQKGRNFKFLKWKFYSGDIQYFLGIDTKIINWKLNVDDKPTDKQHWIHVTKNIPLPYVGFKYFYKNLRVFGNISALSFNIAKSTNYEFGLSYQVYKDLYLNGSYLYEDFQATESAGAHTDNIDFRTSGNKFGFSYIF